jgi:hypothetical protein
MVAVIFVKLDEWPARIALAGVGFVVVLVETVGESSADGSVVEHHDVSESQIVVFVFASDVVYERHADFSKLFR